MRRRRDTGPDPGPHLICTRCDTGEITQAGLCYRCGRSDRIRPCHRSRRWAVVGCAFCESGEPQPRPLKTQEEEAAFALRNLSPQAREIGERIVNDERYAQSLRDRARAGTLEVAEELALLEIAILGRMAEVTHEEAHDM